MFTFNYSRLIPLFIVVSLVYSTREILSSNTSNQLLLPPFRSSSSLSNSEELLLLNNISATVRLCLDSEPDGTAILTDTKDNKEVLAIFKADTFWLKSTDEVVKFAKSPKGYRLFFGQDQTKIDRIWPEFPCSINYAISFTGMKRDHKFHNNVLVFKDKTLYRYKVEKLEHIKSAAAVFRYQMMVKLIGSHLINHWAHMPNLNDIQHMLIPRGTRILIANAAFQPTISREVPVYSLNQANLGNPVAHPAPITGLQFPTLKSSFIPFIRFYYLLQADLTSRTEQALIFLRTGELCINDDCNQLRGAMLCEPQIESFTSSFGYWLWSDTDLTLRLIMVCLSSIMVINFIFAVAFIYNQLKRIVDLT